MQPSVGRHTSVCFTAAVLIATPRPKTIIIPLAGAFLDPGPRSHRPQYHPLYGFLPPLSVPGDTATDHVYENLDV